MPIPNQLAGVQTGRTVTPVIALRDRDTARFLPGPHAFDKDASDPTNTYTYIIRGPRLVARHSTTGLWWPLKRTVTKAYASSGASSTTPTDYTDVPVDDATPFAVGDVITVGGDTGLTILAIDTSDGNHTIRVDSGTFAMAADEQVYETGNGLGICRGIMLDDEVILRDYQNLAAADAPIHEILIAGLVDSSVVRGPVDALRASLMAGQWHPIQIQFDQDFGY